MSSRSRDKDRDDYGPASAGVRNKVSVLVRNIPLTYTAEDLRATFEKYGELRDVYIPRDYYTQRSRGFGFIEFRDARDADEAIYRMDRTTLEGREINVCLSKEGRKTPREMMIIETKQTGDRSGSYGDDRRDRRSRSPRRGSRHSRSRSPRRGGRSRSRSPRGGRDYDRRRDGRDRDYDRGRDRDYDRRDRDYDRGRGRDDRDDRDYRRSSRSRSPRGGRQDGRERERDRSRSPRRDREPSPREERERDAAYEDRVPPVVDDAVGLEDVAPASNDYY
ncbi:hypothetical protein GPECTOR_22g949 [Gonium pectorale]|uniref:RRM domain-containing protein n=1 Tax=Gonium pectorale TaxID=33097 RepID=A0A150GI69_GONPE|nr:hypothetical protein GPECTOR_22g949 [Gonium pectorale]|eukprot:KXZ49355.1 hypothetical protein GPECTOR_22g949 [Gonium pectorale]